MNYISEIENLTRNNRFEHFYLYEEVLKADRNNLEINIKWKKGNEDSWILGFCANNIYNIYGLNFTKELLNTVTEELDFSVLPRQMVFKGNKEIIEYLFSNNPSVEYEIFKERIFYETTIDSFSPMRIASDINIRTANIQDLELLAKYDCQFFEEEYGVQNNKDFKELKNEMKSQIEQGKFIVAEKDNSTIGFCSRFDTNFDNEMIGTVYVDKKYRRFKAGTLLIEKMTEIVLSKNPKCWLMTDWNNIPSNRIMTNLNYNKIYEYTFGKMKKL